MFFRIISFLRIILIAKRSCVAVFRARYTLLWHGLQRTAREHAQLAGSGNGSWSACVARHSAPKCADADELEDLKVVDARPLRAGLTRRDRRVAPLPLQRAFLRRVRHAQPPARVLDGNNAHRKDQLRHNAVRRPSGQRSRWRLAGAGASA